MNQLDLLTHITTEAAEEHGFTLRSPFCDRHGSSEIVFHKADGALDRFAVLALSSRHGSQEQRWLAELYVIAENERFAERELNASFLIDATQFDAWIARSAREAFENALRACQHMIPTEWRRDVLFAAPPELATVARL